MPTNIDTDSAPDRLLYSYHKALDDVLELGAIPQRLFHVLYPVWRVKVQGRQRIATDFEEIEWFLERGMAEIGLDSVAALSRFFGLDERFVRNLVEFLRGIGHISGNDPHLVLTELGQASVQDRVRYQDQETSAVLYFDGLGNRPLTTEHYKVPLYEDIRGITFFWSFFPFDHQWEEGALQRLMDQPDRSRYNLPDEVTQTTLLDREPAYLPAYVVERKLDGSRTLPLFLVFSRIQGRRDAILEEAVNNEAVTQVPLYEARRQNLRWAVENSLGQRGVDPDNWYLQPDGPWGPQVMVDAQVLDRSPRRSAESGERQTLAVRDVGGYFLAHNWCVWLTCDNAQVRRQAALERLLEWLQHVTAAPNAQDLEQRLALMRQKLQIEPITPNALLDAAQERGLARALERLEAMGVATE